MAAPTTQQIKQDQEMLRPNSSSTFNIGKTDSTENMYRQKWQGIFNNVPLCTRYVRGNNLLPSMTGAGSNNTIQVPEDTTERKVAQEVAQSVYSSAPNVWTPEGQSMPDSEIKAQAAKKFLRACATYTKKLKKADTKDANKFMKENPGVGTYGQGQLIPMSDNSVDIFNAGCAAGKQAASYYMTSDQASQDYLASQIKQAMQNKEYNVCFWYTFYDNIKPHDNDMLAEKQTRMNSLTPAYKKYAAQANPETYSEIAGNTSAKQVYNDQARYYGNLGNSNGMQQATGGR